VRSLFDIRRGLKAEPTIGADEVPISQIDGTGEQPAVPGH